MTMLVLIRHGQSVWNAANRFTGWTDVELSEKGEIEAADAGIKLADVRFDVVHTSGLIRAQRTADIVMSKNTVSGKISTRVDERLNERHYGDLQGLNKAETAEILGDQVHIWKIFRRSTAWWRIIRNDCRENNSVFCRGNYS